MPVTFTHAKSYAKLRGYEGMSSMNVSFHFRTYESKGLMMFHAFSSSSFVAVCILFLYIFFEFVYVYIQSPIRFIWNKAS